MTRDEAYIVSPAPSIQKLKKMANRKKTERNKKILELADKGWRHVSIANMLKMKTSAVSVVIHRMRKKREGK